MTNRLKKVTQQRARRSHRVRQKLTVGEARPRLHVYISNRNVSAQVIDDRKGSTLVASSSIGKQDVKGTLTDKATWVGEDIAKKAVAAKIKQVVLDRGTRQYHGRLKALADAARAGGLEL